MRVSIHPKALRELGEAAAFYEEQQPGLGEKFLSAVELAVEGVVAFPERWPIFESAIRRRVIRVYPYAVLYHSSSKLIHILAIMHTHRKPDYWRSRTSN